MAITRPDGQTVAATGIQEVGLNRFRISFASQTMVGHIPRPDRPGSPDQAGNKLDQDRDG